MRVSSGELVFRRVRKHTNGVALTGSQTLFFGLGEWVLVIAAAGGIGMSAVQIAKSMYRMPRLSRVAELILTDVSSISFGCQGDWCCWLTSEARRRQEIRRRGLSCRLHQARVAERGFQDHRWTWCRCHLRPGWAHSRSVRSLFTSSKS